MATYASQPNQEKKNVLATTHLRRTRSYQREMKVIMLLALMGVAAAGRVGMEKDALVGETRNWKIARSCGAEKVRI